MMMRMTMTTMRKTTTSSNHPGTGYEGGRRRKQPNPPVCDAFGGIFLHHVMVSSLRSLIIACLT